MTGDRLKDSNSPRPEQPGRPGSGPWKPSRPGSDKSRPGSTPRKSGNNPPPRKSGGPQGKSGKNKPVRRAIGALEVKSLGGNRFVFVAPECALDRDLDLAEAIEMRAGGEFEIARDELLYLVGDCRGFLEAYLQLAELALEDEDIALAKGHFGFAYEQGLEILPQNFRGQLPCQEGYNAHFFAAGRGLARCLIARREPVKAREVLEQLLKFDPTEPQAKSLLEQLDEWKLSPDQQDADAENDGDDEADE
jgi:tetratricopeptide (TPR) repeat protein